MPPSPLSYVVSLLVGAFIGVLEAETIAFSLLEISVTTVFSIVFGVGFIILGFVLAWRIWATIEGGLQKYLMWSLSGVVVLSGISCFVLNEVWITKFPWGGKVPLYAMLGLSFSFTITFCFSECLVLSFWQNCCDCKTIFANPKQIFALFGVSLFMGTLFGLLFGLVHSQGRDPQESLKYCSIYSISLGVGVGALFGVLNEYFRWRFLESAEEQQHIINRDHDSIL